MKESKEILSTLLSLHMGIDQARAQAAKEGRSLGLRDMNFFIAPLSMVPAAIEGGSLALDEFKNASEEERKQLHADLAGMYDIADDVIEAKVEAALKFLLALGEFVGFLTVPNQPAE